jgi:hypothetical protein
VISSGTKFNRYTLLEVISEHESATSGQFTVALWRGRDEILDRNIAIRLMQTNDDRLVKVLGAAQAAAMADDRRLLRILDILDIGETEEDPAYTAIISEWCTGTPLHVAVNDIEKNAFDAESSLDFVSNIAWALNTCLKINLEHGRLRPSCVFLTENSEVLMSGLAVDHALFGPLFEAETSPDSSATKDVNGLGSLLYCFATGLWPYPIYSQEKNPDPAVSVHVPFSPKAGKDIPLPSSVKASIPRAVDEIVSRSVIGASRSRGVARIQDSLGFANSIASARDYLTPLSTTTVRAPVGISQRTSATSFAKHLVSVAIAVGVVIAISLVGIQLLNNSNPAAPQIGSDGNVVDTTEILTSPATPYFEVEVGNAIGTVPIESVRSFDPRGAPPNGALGTEREENAPLAIDGDVVTAWTTKKYKNATLGTKGGVGLILDLGQEVDVTGVSLGLVGYGTDLQVRVANEILPDPDLWTKLVSIDDAGPQIDLRAPRPVSGRYVLIWLTGIPPMENGVKFQGGVTSASVFGTIAPDPAN